MKRIIIFSSLIASLFVLGCCNPKQEKNIDDNNYNPNESAVVNDDLDDVIEIDTAEVVEQSVDTTNTEPVMIEKEDGSTEQISDENLNKEANDNNNNKRFHVIAGSFKNLNNAVKLKKYYKSKGYSAFILSPVNGFNRVATGTYTSRAQSEKEIRSFRAKKISYRGEKVDYWLLWR